MQPLQYDLQSSAAKDDSITHAAAAPSNLDAAITMRFAASRRKPARIYTHNNTRTPNDNSHAAIPMRSASTEIPKHPITTHTQAHPKQLQATVTLRQKKTTNRPQPHPSHTRGTFHRRLQPLYTEKHKVSCSGFLPKT